MSERRIFVSHTHGDEPIVDALRDALGEIFGDFLKVTYSSSKELEGGIGHGEDWFKWIVQQVEQCDFAFVLLTPSSIQKPWILWEGGAVYGAALGSGGSSRKLRPIVFRLKDAEIPSPFRDTNQQHRRGDAVRDVEQLFDELVTEFGDQLPKDRRIRSVRAIPTIVQTYLARIHDALLSVPLVVTEATVQEWCGRLDDLRERKRMSEVEHLHRWLDVAFGRGADDRSRPLDLRIHRRLGDLYLQARMYDRAVEQFELAQQLSPRDIFILRVLGQAQLQRKNYDQVKLLLDRIETLDANAFTHNTECAALKGRYLREVHDLAAAEAVFAQALNSNPDSYYLADVLGQVRLERGNGPGAIEAYARALRAIDGLRERNVWTEATAITALLVAGRVDEAKLRVAQLREMTPTAAELETIERGLDRVESLLAQQGVEAGAWKRMLHQ
jgi:tetratricopeptide (TPR) repeat protein